MVIMKVLFTIICLTVLSETLQMIDENLKESKITLKYFLTVMLAVCMDFLVLYFIWEVN